MLAGDRHVEAPGLGHPLYLRVGPDEVEKATLGIVKFASLLTKEWGVPTYASLNPVMIDGTGMCGGCRVTVGGQTKFACVDGPEFDGHLVDFDELMLRLQAYCEDEKRCHNEFCMLEETWHKA